MKRSFLVTLGLIFACISLHAQNVFTVVHATSDDGFVNVRTAPNSKSGIVARINEFSYGLGNGILLGEKNGKWVKVSVGNKTGWANSSYLGKQTWYSGKGQYRLVANATRTEVYREDYSEDDGVSFLGYVKKGTIIADQFTVDDDYYILQTAHDCLYIPKSQVKKVRK